MQTKQSPQPEIPSMTKKELLAFKEQLRLNRIAYFEREAAKAQSTLPQANQKKP